MRQEYKRIDITKGEVVPTAERMKKDKVRLAMIHAYIDDNGQPVVSYEYEVGTGIDSYTVTGEKSLPSIESIYSFGAAWPEREIMELMDITFEGLDASKRLFMPENMVEGQGQIMVTPMKELIKKAHGEKEGE